MPKASWGNIEGSPFDEELEDYPVYDGELPPKGVYRFVLKTLRLKTNSSGAPMLNGLLVLNEPSGSKKAQYNGYSCWFNLNVTNQGARWVNNFLSSIVPEAKVAAVRKAFWSQKVMIDKSEPPLVLSIGGIKMPDNGAQVLVSADCKTKEYNGDTDLDPKRFFRPSSLLLGEDPTGAVGDDSNADDDADDWGDDDGETGTDTVEDESEEDDEIAEREEELAGMTLAALKKLAKAEHGATVADLKNLDTNGVVDWILDREFPEEEELEELEEEEIEEELEEEDEEEPEDDEEEPEEEPEPPARTSRRRTPAKAAASASPKAPAASSRSGRRAAAAPKEETPAPAARTRTGSRRRKAGTTEPPF